MEEFEYYYFTEYNDNYGTWWVVQQWDDGNSEYLVEYSEREPADLVTNLMNKLRWYEMD